jgi:subtilisin family serine protease
LRRRKVQGVCGRRVGRAAAPALLLAGCLLLIGSGVAMSTPAYARALRGPPSLPRVEKHRAPEVDRGTLLLDVRGTADVAAVAADHGARRLRAIPGTSFALLATSGRGRGTVMRELRADPRVRRVEPNYVRTASAAPTDPYYVKGRQGYLRSPRFESAWGLVPSASGVTVAVVDTGVDLDTPELAGRILSGRDVVNGNDDPSDDEGHGTEVAGVLAAAQDGRGIAGAAPGAAILPVKVLDAQGQGTEPTWRPASPGPPTTAHG